MSKNYEVLNELVSKTQELHRAIFDKGYLQGFEDGKNDALKRIQGYTENSYKQGMNDAWELCRKIERMLFNKPQFQEAFGEVDFYTVITNMSVSDSMEKVKAWEEKKKSGKTDKSKSTGINVSDVVHFSDNGETMKAVVLDVDGVDETAVIFDENGCVKWIEYKALEKTGDAHLGVWKMLDSLQECVE